jgi:sugar phosphate isomerase/epimerase
MKQLIVACYGSNFDNYDHLYDILCCLRFANPGVELSMFSDKPEHTRKLREQADRFKIFPVTFHGPFVELEPSASINSGQYYQTLDAYREAFEIYHIFSARSIVMHTNQRTFQPGEKMSLQKNVIETINKIGEMAKESRVNLLVENVGEDIFSSMLFDQNEFIELIMNLPVHINCLIDIGHAAINRWNMERVISALSKRIRAYHLHNNNGMEDSHRPLFEKGMIIDPVYLLPVMEKYTPDTDWILEYAPGTHITAALMSSEIEQLLKIINFR